MPVGTQLYDQEHKAPATRGNVVDLWGAEEDWDFPMQGALALQPEPLAVEDRARKCPEEALFPFESARGLRYRAADGYD